MIWGSGYVLQLLGIMEIFKTIEKSTEWSLPPSSLLENPFLCAEKNCVNMFTTALTVLANKSKAI